MINNPQQLFKQKFANEIRYDAEVPLAEVPFKVNMCRNYYSKICIVEGITDIVFYSNINREEFKGTKFISAGKIISRDDVAGKQYVLNAYVLLKNDKNLTKTMNKYIFIVDKDYDGVEYYRPANETQYYNFKSENMRNITLTSGYAFENYFLEENNLIKIFKYFNMEEERSKFNDVYINFLSEVQEFFSWFATVVFAIRKGYHIHLDKNIKCEDIFMFDFSNECIYNKALLEEATEIRKKAVFDCKNNSELKQQQKIFLQKIVNNNYIQGHTIYNLLNSFMKYYYKINLDQYYNNENYINILKLIDIDIIIKLGNGKVITPEKSTNF